MPLDAFSWLISNCISVAVSPDVFMVAFMNVVMAPASPLVPAVDIMLPPPIIPPPMPPIVIEVLPIMPFMTPSDASCIMAVIIEEELVMLMPFAYWDMAAMAMPQFRMPVVAVAPDPGTAAFIGMVWRRSAIMKKLPIAAFAAVMLASVMPPVILPAMVWAMDVSGVI